jgi:AcrR family transcriptional regulator
MKKLVRPSTASAINRGSPARRKLRKAGRPARELRKPCDIDTVIDAAVRVFDRHGYEASSMVDVARETGLSKSSIYYHVASKEELLARSLERAFGPLLALLDEPEAKRGSPLERLKHIVHRVVIITLAYVHEVELLQRIKGNSTTERQALQWRRRFDREIRAIVEQAAAAGEIRVDVEPGLLTRLIFGMSNSMTQWYRPAGKRAPEDIARAVSSLIFEGVEPIHKKSPRH